MSRSPESRTEEQLIRAKLARYLTETCTLQSFWRWFIPATWHIDHTSPDGLRELVYGIKLRVDDYSNNGISEDQLREELMPFVTNATVILDEQLWSGESASETRPVEASA
jgi:hypothetical protein